MHGYSWDADIYLMVLIIFPLYMLCASVGVWMGTCMPWCTFGGDVFQGLVLSLYLDSEAGSLLSSLGCILLASES